jgi:diguanylate cyclase
VLTKPGELQAVLLAVNTSLGKSGSAASPKVAEGFEREHVRFLTDKLSKQTSGLAAANLRLEALIEIGLQLASESQHSCLLEEFCKSARALMNARYAVVGIGTDNGQHLDYVCSSCIDLERYPALTNPLALNSAAAKLMKQGQTGRIRNPTGNPEVLGLPSDCPPLESLLASPIVCCIILTDGSASSTGLEPWSSARKTSGWLEFLPRSSGGFMKTG